jgi:predicted adenylyl cyclase CyaB
MREVEVKIVEIDRAKVEARLRSLGASRILETREESMFFDFPGNPISAAKNLLRLRKEGEKTLLTFKKFVENGTAKVRDEYEVSVSAFEPMLRILEALGLRAFQRMAKNRTSYSLKNGVRVDLDKYRDEFSYIPDLMEIEAKDEPTLQSSIKLLGFTPEDAKSWTTFDLVNYFSAKKRKP